MRKLIVATGSSQNNGSLLALSHLISLRVGVHGIVTFLDMGEQVIVTLGSYSG